MLFFHLLKLCYDVETMKKQLPLILLVILIASVCGYWGGHISSTPQTAPAAKTETAFDRIMQKHEIRCGYGVYPPYTDRDIKTGQITGPIKDIWDAIGERLNIKIVWSEEVSWGTMISGLQSKRYDAVCSPVWANATRSQFVNFTTPIGWQPERAWTRSSETRFDNNLGAINQAQTKIAVLDGEMAIMLANRMFPKAQQIALPQSAAISDLLMNVTTGKADITLMEDSVVQNFLKSNPGTLKIVAGADALQKFPVTFLLPQGDDRLKNMIDQTIQDMLLDQTIQSIMAQAGLGTVYNYPSFP